MPDVIADITISVDGYVTGPDAGLRQGLGEGGEGLHRWAFTEAGDPDAELLAAMVDRTGAVIMGRRTFDVVDGPSGWNEDVAYGAAAGPARRSPPPNFVVTHQAPAQVRLPGMTFVTEGIARAVEEARDAAGTGDVVIMGGASVIDQALAAGLVDELSLHVAPMLLGAGTRLFAHLPPNGLALEGLGALHTANATHLRYRVDR